MQEEIQTEKLIISEEESGKRLDIYLIQIYTENSRNYIKKLIENGDILVNGKIQKSGYKIKQNDEIDICFPKLEEYKLEAQNIDIDIIYQDQDIAIINKPQGMVVHPAVGNLEGTLVNAILYHIKDLSGINGELRPGIVHRIDKDTSGLLVVAKNDFSHRILSEQIKQKTCKRIYVALVHGAPHNNEGEVTTYIGRSPKDRKMMAVVPENQGRIAITRYKLLQKYRNFSLMQFELQTGRTHQIRVHCKYLNIPIVGDIVYGGVKNNFGTKGQMLHACKLILKHPRSNQEMQFEAPIPKYFETILNKLQMNN